MTPLPPAPRCPPSNPRVGGSNPSCPTILKGVDRECYTEVGNDLQRFGDSGNSNLAFPSFFRIRP